MDLDTSAWKRGNLMDLDTSASEEHGQLDLFAFLLSSNFSIIFIIFKL